MIKNNAKTAYRIFAKNKYYFFLNLINLSIGIACGILILLYLESFVSFDKHHLKHSRIYRVGYEFNTSAGRTMQNAKSSERIGPMFKDEYPEINAYVRFRDLDELTVNVNNRSFKENDFLSADTNIFNVFTHHFIAGSPTNCFNKSNSIILVQKLAAKYFGDEDPIGKTILIDSTQYEITGVIKDLPDNVHLKFSALVKFEPIGTQWFTPSCYTYILLNTKSDIQGIYQRYPQLFDKYMSEQAEHVKATIDIILEPLDEIHYHSNLAGDFPRGNKLYIYIFGVVGLIIISISVVNYINLSTAFSISRTKEIGIKKIFGADKKSLRMYFIFESTVVALFAFLISIVCVKFILGTDPIFQLLNTKIQFNLFENFMLYLISFGFALAVGMISGLYPAFYISSIPLSKTTGNAFNHKKRSILLRKSLIVFQFVLSIGVFIGILTMNRQMNFIQKKDLGYNKENLITIPADKLSHTDLAILKEKLSAIPGVISSASTYVLPNTKELMCNFKIETENGFEEQLFNWMIVDYDYLKTMEIEVIMGRDFNKEFPSDANSAYIVNKCFLSYLGWEKGLNKKMRIINGGPFKNWPDGKIIGVVEDFNIASLHQEIQPLILVVIPGGYLHVRTSDNNRKETITKIRAAWMQVAPSKDFSFTFLDQHLKMSYSEEINQLSLIKILSIVCFILSCLGLIGLSAYTLAQRTKEMAIRKQLGASVANIVLMLYKEIALLILIALLIAIPFSNWAINEWINSFAYRIEIHFVIFFISGLFALFIGFVAVTYHSLKAAKINPVKALKYE